jgi:hypothetical protein
MAFDRPQWQFQSFGNLLVSQILVESEPHDVTRRISELVQFVGQDNLVYDLIRM